MSSEILRLLDAAQSRSVAGAAPYPCFIRDDDAGWADDQLSRLLDMTTTIGIPVDLAAIPAAVGDPTVRRLEKFLQSASTLVGIHQHGLCHANHQASGRKGEFGDDRSEAEQRCDLETGRRLLAERFGQHVDPIFTPPWNRCSTRTPSLLARLGYAALSRDSSAPCQPDLPEIRVVVDWSKCYRDGGFVGAIRAVTASLDACLSSGRAFGLMLHHAAMSPTEIRELGGLLRVLKERTDLAWRPMRTHLATLSEGDMAC